MPHSVLLDDFFAHLVAGVGLAILCPLIIFIGVSISLRFNLFTDVIRYYFQRLTRLEYLLFSASLATGFGVGSVLCSVIHFTSVYPFFAISYGLAAYLMSWVFKRKAWRNRLK